MEKKIVDQNTGEVVTFGPACVRSFKGQSNFDKYYIDRTIKQVVNKTGEGEEDFIVVDKVIETKRDISQYIHAQAGDAGVDAYLAPYLETGTKLPNVVVSDQVQDFSNMPESLADAALLGDKARDAFKSLDKSLIDGLTYEQFLSSFTQEKFDAWVASMKKQPDETQKKKEGE